MSLPSTPSDPPLPFRALTTPILLASLSFGILGFILPIYAKQLGASAVSIGGLFSVFFLVITLLRPLVGWGLDRFGRKLFLIIAMAFYAAAMLIFSRAGDLVTLYVARFVQGLGSAFLWIAAYTLATDLAHSSSRGQAVGRVDAASSQGALYGGLLGFALIWFIPIQTAWQVMFLVYAFFALAAAFLIWRRLPDLRAPVVPGNLPSVDWNRLLRLMVIVFTTNASISMISPLLLIFLQDRFTTEPALLAQAFLPAVLVYSFLPPFSGRLSDRFGRTRLMSAGLVLAGLVSLAFPTLASIWVLIVLWVVEAVGFTLASPAQEALVADLTGDQTRGRAYGIYTFASGLGATCGPLLGGWLYDTAGHGVPFYANAAVLILSALWVLLLLGSRKSAPAVAP